MYETPYDVTPYLEGQAIVFWIGILSLAAGMIALMSGAVRRIVLLLLAIVVIAMLIAL